MVHLGPGDLVPADAISEYPEVLKYFLDRHPFEYPEVFKYFYLTYSMGGNFPQVHDSVCVPRVLELAVS